mgnify:CR=1 FL=1|tara:strand:+ start:848 stop:1657 length:810 start_codon:yes stop_codon:yes gene_type:complete
MIEYAIPSYNRPQELFNTTLKLLTKFNIPQNQITIFLEDVVQENLYINLLQDQYPLINYEIKKTQGIGELRTYIRKFYPVGSKVVMIDDDTQCVMEMINNIEPYEKKNNKLSFMTSESFNKWINEAFQNLENNKGKNFGIVLFGRAPYYMTRSVSKNLRYVCGNIVGFIVQNEEPDVSIAHGEDFEFSIKLFKRDGELYRYNYITVKTKHYAKGGICDTYGGEEEREIKAKENLEYLVDKYKGAFTLYKKKNGKHNLRVNPKYKNIDNS